MYYTFNHKLFEFVLKITKHINHCYQSEGILAAVSDLVNDISQGFSKQQPCYSA